MDSNKEIQEFYNNYVSKQQRTGINIRHRLIHKKAKENGLRENSNVLEIGCGIGSYTTLILDTVGKGRIVSTDISDASIEVAKRHFASYPNVSFYATDMSDFRIEMKFDFVILADVLEHIPVENHAALFKTIRNHCHDQSKILINIPHPHWLEWLHIHDPSILQIIDQPVHTNILLNIVYPNGFYLDRFVSYALFHDIMEYQFMVFKIKVPFDRVVKFPKWKLALNNFISKIFW